MVSGKATGRDGWLGLLCLAVSFGVHAGLLAVSLPGLKSTLADVRPLTVVLLERPPMAVPELPLPEPILKPSGVADRPLGPPPIAPPSSASENPEAAVAAEPAGAGGEDDSASSGGAFSIMVVPTTGKEPGRQPHIKATPRYESNPVPLYPQLARQNRWEGTVRVRVRVTAGGVAEAVSLERSSGYEVLDRAALAGVQQWRFIPAMRGGVPVPSEVSIPVAFRLK